MALNSAPVQERRRFPRGEGSPRVAINLLQPNESIAVDSVNFSEGGFCLRLQELLEVRSLVRLQVTPERGAAKTRPVECMARVAWVIQRLDLRDIPPFLYDVGIEFVDPPTLLRQFLARSGAPLSVLKRRPGAQERQLEPALLHGRRFAPTLERDPAHAPHWHLVVVVDGVPCHSGRYPSERAALAEWDKFKRRQSRAVKRPVG